MGWSTPSAERAASGAGGLAHVGAHRPQSRRLGPLVALGVTLALAYPVSSPADPATPALLARAIVRQAPPASPAARLVPIEDLILLPVWSPEATKKKKQQSADDAIALAVAAGSEPPRARRHGGFQKHNFDLFRTEREIEIGDREMVVRLRLRPKSRETVSVELRF